MDRRRSRRFRSTYLILSLIIVSAFCQTNTRKKKDPSCASPCSCCLASSPCTANDPNCRNQCKDGYIGNKCLNSCPTNCVRCTAHPDVSYTNSTYLGYAYCPECKDGYYSTSRFYQCQFSCPAGCQTCDSDTNCISCSDGYFKKGTTCKRCKTGCAFCTSRTDCSQCEAGFYNSEGTVNILNCVACSEGCSNQCDHTLGTCSCSAYYTGDKCDTCVDGRYGVDCRNTCQSACKTCTSRYVCTSCVDGHFMNGNTCQSCQPGCAQCSPFTDCTRCKDGFYRSDSKCVSCSLGCSNVCDKVSGTCSCKPQYSGGKCDTCTDGKYGITCDHSCRLPCKTCTSSTACKSCIDGYVMQGTTCSLQCKRGCAECSTFGNCIRCMDRYYASGTDCIACSNGCNNQCDKETGTCNCKPGFDGEKCDRCMANFNGTNCNICIDGSLDESCAPVLATGGTEGETPWAAIGGGVASALVIIVVVSVIIILFRRRLRRTSDGSNRQTEDDPTYINVTPVTASETKETRKVVKTKARKLQKYEQHQLKHHQKEAKYAEKVARIRHELDEIRRPPNIRGIEDSANSGTESQTYEGLSQLEADNHLYSDLRTK